MIGCHRAGRSTRQIARQFGVAQSQVVRLIARWRQTRNVTDMPRTGRPRLTTARDDRRLTRMALRDRFASARQLRDTWMGNHNIQVSRRTTNRRLVADGLMARRPRRKPILTARHKRDRLAWATYRQTWNIRTWRRVLWTDESKFNLVRSDGRMRVRRRANEALREDCILPRVQGGGGSVMVWGGFSFDGKMDLQIVEGRLTGARYRDEIVLNAIVPHINAHPDRNLILVQDNAPVHKARVTLEALQNHGVACMDWPAISPDLNVIEHAWDIIGRALNNRQPAIQNIQELRRAIIDEWNRIPLADLQHLVQSCRRRCQAVVQNRGGHTRY